MNKILFYIGLIPVACVGGALGAAGMSIGGLPGLAIAIPICIALGYGYARWASLFL